MLAKIQILTMMNLSNADPAQSLAKQSLSIA
jgi:hypothetical protein